MTRTSTIIITLIIVFTFPLWFGLGMGLFGLIFGLIGGAIGIVAGVFGAVIGVIAGVFGAIFHGIFGWGHGGHNSFPGVHLNGYVFLALIILAALVLSKRNKTT
ncbi:MAG: hypothetical protein KBF45_00520 [Cyclobacteriaceae bacterium]|nr:hypothetical protein [Cyclobacteriaceae bacterium]